MHSLYYFFSMIYPYICLTIFITGIALRYAMVPLQWNAKSSEIFERTQLRIGSMLFHYGIILSLFGHIIGLLFPPEVLAALGLSNQLHLMLATFMGRTIVPLIAIGLALLLWRRLTNSRVRTYTSSMDLVIILLIAINTATGGYQTYTEHFPALGILGVWIRDILTFHPNPFVLMELPWFMWMHIISGMTLFALLPFSRLVHILSVPYTYAVYPLLQYRHYRQQRP